MARAGSVGGYTPSLHRAASRPPEGGLAAATMSRVDASRQTFRCYRYNISLFSGRVESGVVARIGYEAYSRNVIAIAAVPSPKRSVARILKTLIEALETELVALGHDMKIAVLDFTGEDGRENLRIDARKPSELSEQIG